MNEHQTKYLINYFKDKIKGKDKFSYISYSIKYKGLNFTFESVEMYSLSLLCNDISMSYYFNSGIAACGCGEKKCIHKEILKDLINEILKGKDF
jgi:hypothetical protein